MWGTMRGPGCFGDSRFCSVTALFHGAIPGDLEGEGELVCTGQEPAAWPFPALSPCSSCCSRRAAGCQLLLSGFHWSRRAEIHWGRQEQRRDAAPLSFPQKPDPSAMGSPGQGPTLSPPESGPPIFRRWLRKYQTHKLRSSSCEQKEPPERSRDPVPEYARLSQIPPSLELLLGRGQSLAPKIRTQHGAQCPVSTTGLPA